MVLTKIMPESGQEGVFPLAGEYRAMVHLASALVGASGSGLEGPQGVLCMQPKRAMQR